jgi:hypothetical protein
MLPWSRMGRRIGAVIIAVTLVSAAAAQDPQPPLPPPRPDRPATPSPEASGEKASAKEDPTEKAPEAREANAACIDRITSLGIRFESRPPVQENACSVNNPVLVSALPNGIEVAPASLMACPVAESLARWVGDAVTPEA